MTIATDRLPLVAHFRANISGRQHSENDGCHGASTGEFVPCESLMRAPDTILPPFQNTLAMPAKSEMQTKLVRPILPDDLFSRSPAEGAQILQMYLNGLPESERYGAFAPLVRNHWKWMCKAAPYLKFPEPKPILEGQIINIGIWVWRLTVDGIGRVMQLVANHYARDPRTNITIFISDDQAGKIDFTLHPNVTVVSIPGRRSGGGNWAKLMEEYPQDVVICPEHYLVENMQNMLLLKLLGVRIIAQEHNFALCRQPFTSLSDKFAHLTPLYSCCDATTCLSRVDLYKWRREGLGNVFFLPNPPTFDPSAVPPSNLQSKNILWIGRWSTVKRPDLAIKVFAEVYKKFPDARLIMLGEHYNSAYFRKCLKLANECGVGHAVNILGFQKEMEPYYANGAVLLSTSCVEGCPMVAIEAKAHGIPVVCSSLPWVEVLQRGCIQTPKGDEAAMANALMDLLQNPEKRHRLGKEAQRDILENFSEKSVFAQYDAIIRAVLNGSAAVKELFDNSPPLDSETLENTLSNAIKTWGK